MKLVELINYFRKGNSFNEFCKIHLLDLESEVIEVYMEKPFDLSNGLSFFEIEKTEGRVEYVCDNITYFNLFDFYYFLEVIEEVDESITDLELAKKILNYAIYDA